MIGNTNSFGKTICSICYEDLNPIVEDLQSISICGHVFHELCLQQWFEYCSSTKKCTCPVCKQGCKAKDASRLYFQSIGGDSTPSLTQRPILDREEDPETLRREVRRLEAKVLALDSVVERQGKELREVNEELFHCKEHGKTETTSKNEALKEKAFLQQMLRLKTEELDKSTFECLKLQERSMALAKELASLKVVCDLDLDEEEVLKFASFGNGANNQDTIDVLRRSLLMRNRSYKELMTKCNILGRGESRSTKKLEKAKEKISKLKERVKELELSAEVKDNEVLRELKASKKTRYEDNILIGLNCKSNSLVNNNVLEDKSKQCSMPIVNLGKLGNLEDELLRPRKIQKFSLTSDRDTHNIQDGPSATVQCKEKDPSSFTNPNISRSSTAVHGFPFPDSKHQASEEDVVILNYAPNISNVTSHAKKAVAYPYSDLAEPSTLKPNFEESAKTFAVGIDEDVTLIRDNATQVKPTLNIIKESSTVQALSNPGGTCFSGGLLGPDGTNRYLGKWCKRSQNKETGQDTNASSNHDLIAVGADGRGGRIKVLRSLNQSSLDSRENSVGMKRVKYGGKTNSQPSRGCLQIEHFFGKVSN